MWKWIQDNSLGITATIAILAGIVGIILFIVGTEVKSQIREDIQPKIVALQTTTTKHGENIKEIRTDLKEIKQDIRNLDQKFTTQFEKMDQKFTTQFEKMDQKFISLHTVLIPMRDAIVEIQRDVKELKEQ